ncbi:MAG: hypothetical protein Q7T57_08675 [Dehalococcoidales bacterium]|nr:hypothetical protein [Dehalococcoidales bacterium]
MKHAPDTEQVPRDGFLLEAVFQDHHQLLVFVVYDYPLSAPVPGRMPPPWC